MEGEAMRKCFLPFFILFLFCIPILASEPREPLDASDIVFFIPGLTATDFLPRCECDVPWCFNDLDRSDNSQAGDNRGPYVWDQPVIDADGYQYAFRHEGLVTCNGSWRKRRYIIRMSTSGTQEDVAYIEDRCFSDTTNAVNKGWLRSLRIDNNIGCLYLVMITAPYGSGGGTYPDCASLIKICGLTTQHDVLQTYQLQSQSFGFRVPYMPEGLNGADYFDTYWGDLSNPIDFSQAKPLQCGYPSTQPDTGDYLEFIDSLPDPSAGEGYYYITATHFQGETCYGRQRIDGELSGRNPALLPACQ